MFLDFIFTTWILWPSILGLFVLFAVLSENNHGGFAGFIIAGLLTGFQLFSSYQPLTYLINSPLHALWIAALYLVIGFIYMYVKWAFVARKASIWAKENPNKTNYYSYNGRGKTVPFKVSEWKSDLLTWFALWPFSAAWTFLNDPIRIIFDNVYAWSSARLQKISDSFFKV